MKTVPLKNQKLLELLYKSDKIADQIKLMDFEISVGSQSPAPQFDDIIPYSDEYLKRALDFESEEFKELEFNFPRHTKGICQQQAVHDFVDVELTQKMNTYGNRVATSIGAERNALFMIYPPGGYIGWHHNANAPGYNVLFTQNDKDQGWFKYRDSSTGDIVTMQDPIGWSCKVGYYPTREDVNGSTDDLFWHTAHNDSWRRTIAFVVPEKGMWLAMIDMIADGDVDLSTY